MTQQEQAGADDFWSQRQPELEAKLDSALVAQRDAFDGGRRKLTYLEGHACIAQLNRIFGYGAWSYTLDQMGVDECTQGPQEDWYAQFFAVVTLRVGGASRQDLGTAEIRNTKRTDQRSGVVSVRNNVRNVDSRATARKGAVTDALKRAARTFGQQFGNGLYDQDDNIYAWMAAHSLCAEEGEAAGAASGSTPAGAEPAAKDKDKEAPPSASRTASAIEGTAHGGAQQQGSGAVVPQSKEQLAARIRTLAGDTLPTLAQWADLAKTHGHQPLPYRWSDMNERWLRDLYQAMVARRLSGRLRSAPNAEATCLLMTEALERRAHAEISDEQYEELDRQATRRCAQLEATVEHVAS